MSAPLPPGPEPALAEILARVEQRLARLEERVGLVPLEAGTPADSGGTDAPFAPLPGGADGEELEFLLGQNWFASVGVIVLTCGAALTLSLPFAGLPPFAPSLIGFVLSAGLFLFARLGRRAFALVAGYLEGAGLALLYFSTLRLYFFGETSVLEIDSVVGRTLLLAVVAAVAAVALRRKSPWLLALAVVAGEVTAVLVGAAWFIFAVNSVLASLAVAAAVRHRWPGLLLLVVPAAYISHLLWALNRPWHGREEQLVQRPIAGIYFILVYAVIVAAGSLLRRDRTREDPFAILAALLNCGGAYGLLLIQTYGLAANLFVPAHLAAAAVLLGLAVAYWRSERSRVATFFYAMTGYLALSVALLKAFPVPDIFLWLSLQSLVVVTTALWFCSRLIVVANFFIYAGLVVSYMAMARQEHGISLGFGVVALLTARVLHWQQRRLELKTELMRNVYLACAFVVFPYALYQLVPRAYVSVAWVGVAVAYYLMNLMVRSPKYRWMGHLTLLLTLLYVLVVGITQLSPSYRILSFLVLGSVLLVVSLLFTRAKAHPAARRSAAPSPAAGPVEGATENFPKRNL